MKVCEMIELLKTCDQDATLLLSSDEEGNCFSVADGGIAEGSFNKDQPNYKEITDRIWTMRDNELQGNWVIIFPR